jgi:hypothetical protein
MAALVVGISLLLPSSSTAAGAPDGRPTLVVRLLSANGSGCRGGGSTPPAAAEMQPTGAFAVRYRDFVVSGGDYRTCTVVVSVTTTAGWTYLVPSVRNQARVALGPSGTAQLATSMWFTGFDWTLTDDKQVTGPFNSYWETSAAAERPAWAPCGESVNLAIAETIRVAAAPSNSASLVTTTLGPPQWRRC